MTIPARIFFVVTIIVIMVTVTFKKENAMLERIAEYNSRSRRHLTAEGLFVDKLRGEDGGATGYMIVVGTEEEFQTFYSNNSGIFVRFISTRKIDDEEFQKRKEERLSKKDRKEKKLCGFTVPETHATDWVYKKDKKYDYHHNRSFLKFLKKIFKMNRLEEFTVGRNKVMIIKPWREEGNDWLETEHFDILETSDYGYYKVRVNELVWLEEACTSFKVLAKYIGATPTGKPKWATKFSRKKSDPTDYQEINPTEREQILHDIEHGARWTDPYDGQDWERIASIHAKDSFRPGFRTSQSDAVKERWETEADVTLSKEAKKIVEKKSKIKRIPKYERE